MKKIIIILCFVSIGCTVSKPIPEIKSFEIMEIREDGFIARNRGTDVLFLFNGKDSIWVGKMIKVSRTKIR